MMTVKDHIKVGRDSGFSGCCIVFFLIRSILGNKILGPNRFCKLVIWRWKSYGLHRGQHVFCPLCSLKNAFRELPPYFRCTGCNWMQYRKATCNKCNGPMLKLRPKAY